MENGRMVEHHIKYKEIHGYDETVIMRHGEHIKLHNRLRKEGKCNISVAELKKISNKANQRTDKAKENQLEYYKNLTDKQKKRRKEYDIEYKKNNKEKAKKSWKKYYELHKEERREYGKKYRERHNVKSGIKMYSTEFKMIGGLASAALLLCYLTIIENILC